MIWMECVETMGKKARLLRRKTPYEEERIERRISALTSLSLCVITVLFQLSMTFWISRYLWHNAGLLYILMTIVGLTAALMVYLRNGSPSYKLVWMCFLIGFPVAGVILFFLWGGTKQAKRLSLREIPPLQDCPGLWEESAKNLKQLSQSSPALGRLAAYLQKRHFWLYAHTRAAYLKNGAVFFEDLIAHMKNARKYIFLEYYILSEGKIWDQMFDVLRERAAAGVQIYIIFDDFGNLARFSDDSLQAMQNAGIEAAIFNPVHKYVSRIYFNFRDHRKIAVIDGVFAWTGGINIGDEYANLYERFGYWKDCGVRIEGEGAWGFAAQFMRMWKMVGRHFPHSDAYYQPEHNPPERDDLPQDTQINSDASLSVHKGASQNSVKNTGKRSYKSKKGGRVNKSCHSSWESDGLCQPFTDGPLNRPDTPIEGIYLQLIASAQKRLYITTPYYAVEDSMQKALCIAADSGVDVRLIVPMIPDHKLTYMVAETYWGELMRHGVKIFKYTPGFIHSKTVMIDDEVALIGSTNMDYRTFQLHYECGVLLYHMNAVQELRRDLEEIIQKSSRYTLEDWLQRPIFRRVFASILKLGAIWL